MRWIGPDDTQVSRVMIQMPTEATGLRAAVASLRRALRDVRDRTARRNRRWREVTIAGMTGGDGRAVVLVRHSGIVRADFAAVLHRRWPFATIGDVDGAAVSWEMSIEAAVEIARARRGVEPLRIVILGQRHACHIHDIRAMNVDVVGEPMPIVF